MSVKNVPSSHVRLKNDTNSLKIFSAGTEEEGNLRPHNLLSCAAGSTATAVPRGEIQDRMTEVALNVKRDKRRTFVNEL